MNCSYFGIMLLAYRRNSGITSKWGQISGFVIFLSRLIRIERICNETMLKNDVDISLEKQHGRSRAYVRFLLLLNKYHHGPKTIKQHQFIRNIFLNEVYIITTTFLIIFNTEKTTVPILFSQIQIRKLY